MSASLIKFPHDEPACPDSPAIKPLQLPANALDEFD